MATLPTPEQLGGRQAPRGQRPTLVQRGAGEAELAEMAGDPELITNVERLKNAGERITLRNESISRLRDKRDFRTRGGEETLRVLAEGTLSDPAVGKQHRDFLSALEKEILTRHSGRADSQVQLAETIDSMKFGLVQKVASAGYTAQQKMIENELGEELGRHRTDTAENFGNLIPNYQAFSIQVDDMALSEEKKIITKQAGLAVLAETAIDSMILSGAVRDVWGLMNDAMDIVNHKQVAGAMGEERHRRVMNKINAALKPGRPFVVNGSLISPTGKVLFKGTPEVEGMMVQKLNEDGSTTNLFVNKKDGTTIHDFGTGPIPDEEIENVVVEVINADGSKSSRLISKRTGETIQHLGTGPTPSPNTEIIQKQMPDGMHNVLIDKDDGTELADLGLGKQPPALKGRPGDQFLHPVSGEPIFIIPKEAEPLESAFVNERGQIRPKVSAEIRRQTAQFVGGGYDVASGAFTGMSREEAKASQELSASMETLLRSQEAMGIAEALGYAAQTVELPEEADFVEIAKTIITLADPLSEPSPAQLADSESYRNRAKVKIINVGDATGLQSTAIHLFNNTLGQLNASWVDQDVVKGRQRLALLEGDFINAFNRAPRLPVWEQIRLTRIFEGPAAFKAPEAVKGELKNIDDMLTEHIDQKLQVIGKPIEFKDKQQLLADIGTLAQFRSRIRAFDIRIEGTVIETIEDLQGASKAAVTAWAQGLGAQGLDDLDDDFRSEVMRILRSP